MNKREDRRLSGCTGKKKMTAQEAQNNRKYTKLNTYHCKYCGFWHVGNSAGKLLDNRKDDSM